MTSLRHQLTSWLLRYHIYDIIGIGAWQEVYAMLHQNFNDITNWKSVDRTSDFLKQFFSRVFNFYFLLNGDHLLKERIYFPRGKFFTLRTDSFLKGLQCPEKQTGSRKTYPLCKISVKLWQCTLSREKLYKNFCFRSDPFTSTCKLNMY